MTKNDQGNSRILVVDDEISMREFLEILLGCEGYVVSTAESGQRAIEMVTAEDYDLLLCDIRLGDMSGLEILQKAKEKRPEAVVIMISAYASAETAVEAMNTGAYDYVPKPFDKDELLQTVKTALKLKTIEHEKAAIENELKKTMKFGRIVGNSPGMQKIYKMIEQVADTRSNVLISGESGTGKELIARALHEQSRRAKQPFVVINCGGIPENLMESELFGHVKGAFTGATYDKKGLFEVADKGTVFLDEIGELNLLLQVKLLRVVQERVFKPVGGSRDISVDIRLISATNKNLEEEVIAGRFREDLFYRLNVIEIKVPPLRDRKSDIRYLAQHFLEKYCREMGKEIFKISSYAIDLLNKYDFPGNIRELENLMERSVALTNTNILLPDSLALSFHKRKWNTDEPVPLFPSPEEVAKGICLDEVLMEVERTYIKRALDVCNWDRSETAELLDINVRSLRYRLDKLGIERDGM